MAVVQPTRPWRRGRAQVQRHISIVTFSVACAAALVQFTGVNGKLGFAACLMVLAITSSAIVEGRGRGIEAAKAGAARAVMAASAVIVLIPLASILYTVVANGLTALRGNFFTQDMRIASFDADLAEGGALHALVGTLQLIVIATFMSLPIGILTALYLTEIRGRFAPIVRFLVQAMSGVPSIVAGLFIYSALILHGGIGYSGFAGGLSLAILMLPTVARTAEEVLKLVPSDLREAGEALGATQWRTVTGIVLPTARSGLVTAAILGIARVAGETAPLVLTIFGSNSLTLNPVGEPIAALPLYIFQAMRAGLDIAISRAWTAAFVLMLFVLLLFSAARILSGRNTR